MTKRSGLLSLNVLKSLIPPLIDNIILLLSTEIPVNVLNSILATGAETCLSATAVCSAGSLIIGSEDFNTK
jgi:hypothetical protein